MKFLSLVQILCQRVPVRVILELLNQYFDDFLSIRVFFLEVSEVYLEFCNQRYRDKFPCTARFVPVMVGGFSHLGIRRILTSVLQSWREYNAR